MMSLPEVFSRPLDELTKNNVELYLAELFAQHEVRIPVVADETEERLHASGAYDNWRLLSGAMLHAIQNRRLEAGTFSSFLQEPLAEDLACRAMQAAQGDPVIDRLTALYPSVTELVTIPPVPDEQIGPSLRQSHKLVQISDIRASLFMEDPANYILIDASRAMATKKQEMLRGISDGEARLVQNRYRFGREVKLLALADALSQHPGLQFDENGVATLSDGTVIGVCSGKEEMASGLLDITTWRGRSELHDRVHHIKTTAGDFIMKEHKGGRHALTLDIPDISNADSAQEIAIASDFMSLESVQDGEVTVSWEKAIGYVRDPSGFDFAMFEYEKDLISRETIKDRLSASITEHQAAYQAEFELARSQLTDGDMMDWETFVTAKVYLMRQHATQLLRKNALENGYIDDDNFQRMLPVPDHEYRIHIADDGQIRLEIIGMDYEHFIKPSDRLRQACIDGFNDLIEENPVDAAPFLVKGLDDTAMAMAEAIVTQMRLQGKRHLPDKIAA